MQQKLSLTEGSIPRALLFFALPILAGNVLQSLNGSVNAVWVGHYLGQAAFAATGNANVVMFLLADRWQDDAIWWAFPVSSITSMLMAVTYFRYGSWRKDRMAITTVRVSAPKASV